MELELTGVFLAHELQGLLLVAEALAVVVVAAGEVVAEGLLVEVGVEGGRRGRRRGRGVAADGGGRAPAAPALGGGGRGRGGRGEEGGAELRGDGRHRLWWREWACGAELRGGRREAKCRGGERNGDTCAGFGIGIHFPCDHLIPGPHVLSCGKFWKNTLYFVSGINENIYTWFLPWERKQD